MPDSRVCLLTGAGGVLGRAFCERWRNEFDIVAVHRRRAPDAPSQREHPIDPLDPSANGHGRAVFAIESDLTRPGELARVVELALARFGRVDLVVNAAVHVRHERLTTAAIDPELLRRHFELNVSVPVELVALLAKTSWLFDREANEAYGRNVVNVSSLAGLGLAAGMGLAPYSASKAALNMLTGHLAAELGPVGIRVNALAPTSFPRLVPTETVCDAVVHLDRSDLTGAVVALDEHGARTYPAGSFAR
jgi:NAD(P)-dependent dehydrogenase (short-subunit alcohol dehydrogenase family)